MKLQTFRPSCFVQKASLGRRWIAISIFLTALFWFYPQGLAAQDGFNPNDAERMMTSNVVELKEQLYFGLRTFRPEQRAFLDQVVAKVENKEISRAMVNVIFVWAQKRNPKVPFPYFEIALKLLAEKRGVTFS